MTTELIDPAELTKIKQSNLSKLEALANQGLTMSVGDLAFIKMEALIDLFVTDEETKIKLEYLIELKKKEVIDQIMAEVRKAQLMQGVSEAKNKLGRSPK